MGFNHIFHSKVIVQLNYNRILFSSEQRLFLVNRNFGFRVSSGKRFSVWLIMKNQ